MKAHVIDPRASSSKDRRLVGLCGEEVRGVYVRLETTTRILCEACKAVLARTSVARTSVEPPDAGDRLGPQRASAPEETSLGKSGTARSSR